MRFTLKMKLISLFFVLITIPLTILGVYSYQMSKQALQTSIEEVLQSKTANAADNVNSAIENVQKVLEVATYNEGLGKVAAHAEDASIKEAFSYLRNVQDNTDAVYMLLVVDKSGRAVTSSTQEIINDDMSDQSYVQKALAGEDAISDVMKSIVDGGPIVMTANPLMDGDKIVGALVGTIDFREISKYAAGIKIGKQDNAFMIDRQGNLVYHANKKLIGKKISDFDGTGEDFKALVEEMKLGKTSEGFYNYEGGKKYIRFQPAGQWAIASSADYKEYMAPALDIRNKTIITIIISVLLALAIAFFVSAKTMVNPIKKIQSLMARAGDGDLTVSVDVNTHDEIEDLGHAFNSMVRNQAKMVEQVKESAMGLAASSQEMAASSEELNTTTKGISGSIHSVANDAEKQSESITDASKVLIQLASLVQVAQNKAKVSSDNADHTMKVAGIGRSKVHETVNAINGISDATDRATQALGTLNELSLEVGGIVETINAIANQTNLLALNAAIEAARAGEHGKGFSVVADEVRKLSEESNSKASEIAALVHEMKNHTKQTVDIMNLSKTEVDKGVSIVSETDRAFVDIIQAVEEIVSSIDEIMNITKEEVGISDKIVNLINKIATTIEQTSSNSKEVSHATTEQGATISTFMMTSEEISRMAENLATLVEKFNISSGRK